MNDQDIRWVQRLANFVKAFDQLNEATQLRATRALSKLEKQGVIQAFEYTYELAWNVLRDFLRWQGNTAITGSRDTIREAFAAGLIDDGETWMRMLQDRNRTSHTYNEETAEAILVNVFGQYHTAFLALKQRMQSEIESRGLY
ncbi:MAG: nucleotidyltransferase [Marinobacter sp. 34-60-7]|nr:MAG: nucleotidyltransferase [Marinobacter sp. 34-60-7]